MFWVIIMTMQYEVINMALGKQVIGKQRIAACKTKVASRKVRLLIKSIL
jgi:hypothetical protein